jgi:regulator of protease activity HflC (stomatin/prohibitin superfamily)
VIDKLWELVQWAFEALVPFVILLPYERGCLIRLGKFNRVVEPGFHWVLPLHLDTILHENVVARTEHIQALSTTTADGRSIGFDAVVTYRINDIQKALLEVNDLKDAVADSCAGHIGTALADSSWHDIWHGDVTEKLTAICRKRGWRWGIEVISVQLAGVCLVKNLRLSGNSGTTNHWHVP